LVTSLSLPDVRDHVWCDYAREPSLFSFVCSSTLKMRRRRNLIEGRKSRRTQMNTKQLILASCAVLALGVGTAQAGPCNTVGKSAQRDAGAGPTPGNTGQTTTGSATTSQQPPTGTMSRATGGSAASSEDAQKQMQGQPTVAQQAQGAKASGPMADQGC
jgi:hypothetical protein